MTNGQFDTGMAAAGERWGWEPRTEQRVLPEPFPSDPPAPVTVAADWTARLASTRRKTAADGGYAHLRRWGAVVMALLGLVVWSYVPVEGTPDVVVTLGLIGALLAGMFFAVRPVALPAWGDLRYHRWLRGVLERQVEAAARTGEWMHGLVEYQRQIEAHARPGGWSPLRPATTQRVDVYGGDRAGTGALLLSMAGSLLESGGRVTVVDFSGDAASTQLLQRAEADARPTLVARLPEQLDILGLFEGLTPADVANVVAEAVHIVERGRDAGGDRTLDVALLERVCGCLAGPPSLRRLHAAVEYTTAGDQHPGRPDCLDPREAQALKHVFGETDRGGLDERLFRLSAALQGLAALEPRAPGRVRTEADSMPLVVWETSHRVDGPAADLLAQVVFGVLLTRLRDDRFETGRVLVVLGADRFRREHLERLDQLARRREVRLVLFFKHLRDDAIEVIGGGEAVMFMRLGNAKEAEHAATFIGRGHKMVLNSYTVSQSSSLSSTLGTTTSQTTGTSESKTKGRQWSRTRNYAYGSFLEFPHDTYARNKGGQSSTSSGTSDSTSTGTSESTQTGTSESTSTSYQRVYEFDVEPRLLQSLPSAAFVMVDPRDPGSPRIGDASPELDQQTPVSLNPPAAAGPAGAIGPIAQTTQIPAGQGVPDPAFDLDARRRHAPPPTR